MQCLQLGQDLQHSLLAREHGYASGNRNRAQSLAPIVNLGRLDVLTDLFHANARSVVIEFSSIFFLALPWVLWTAVQGCWLEPTHREFSDRGLAVQAHACDITDPQQTQSVVQAALDRFGRVIIL